MPTRYLTTGQVADILSVKSDTVLKWIRSGLLPARRTAGGHHRINESDLDRLTHVVNESALKNAHRQKSKTQQIQYCWEFYGNGCTSEDCLKCAVYLIRAQRCYEVAELAPELEIQKTYCKKSCEECDYYDLVHDQNANVLVVTTDKQLSAKLLKPAEALGINLQIADSAYSCSLLINDFRPDFAVIDCEIGPDACEIGHHLVKDPRIPNIRLIIAGECHDFPPKCDKKVLARIKKPTDLFAIVHILERVSIENNN
jgi:excisionase family DNA binding protein